MIQAVERPTAEVYVGISSDVGTRLQQHNTGKGAKYTRGRGPWVLLRAVPYATKGDALREELRLKKLWKSEKLKWARQP